MQPVNFANVTINDAFWKPKLDKVATKTLDACIYQTEQKTPRIRNFEKVASGSKENTKGFFMMIPMSLKHWKRSHTP